MLMQHCSTFNCDRINQLLSYYHQQSPNLDLPKKILNYEEFCTTIPILYDNDLNQRVHDFLRLGLLNNCTFTTSSATSGNYKLIAQRIDQIIKPTPDNYPYHLIAAISKFKVFNSTDIVANLTSAGGMSMLFDRSNRLLEVCGASLLPIGRLDTMGHTQATYLKYMVDLSVNTLFGTPSSLIQCANALQEAKLQLNIEKVVFVGEMFTKVKRDYTRHFFPKMQVYGLYGQTETGVLGIHTPHCHDDFYHLFTDFFFVEITSSGEILITDLTKPVVPLFRYYVGDLGELNQEACSCKSFLPTLRLKGRCDKKFNYMGNLISYEKIKQLIAENYGKKLDIQIQLRSDDLGNDLLNIIVDDNETNLNMIKAKLINALSSVDEINEGIQKKVGKINLYSRDRFLISHRMKLPLIIDTRSKETAHSYQEIGTGNLSETQPVLP